MLNNELRIIAGQWRGRKLKFPNVDGLRPTSDRLRETLFNWVAPHCLDATCLDAFAGSGALGFEALSRGAASVVMLDKSKAVVSQLKANQELLKTPALHIYQQDAVDYLSKVNEQFDLIFLDPPFALENLLVDSLKLIKENRLLREGGLAYIESSDKAVLEFDECWFVKKEKQLGNVMARLCCLSENI